MEKNLTIIIPTYNDSLEKINKTLQSIATQKEYDFERIEIIIVDDCTTNKKIDWNKIKETFSFLNIKYIKHLENKGPGVARQTALNIAKGNFIFFLDCGDALFDNYVLKEFNNYQKLPCDIISTKIYDVESGNKRKSFLFNNAYIFGIFIKKEFLTKHNIGFSDVLRWEEDTLFEEQLRYYMPVVISTKTVGYTYSNDSDSITRKNNHEYTNEYVGFSAMIVKSIILCNFYKKQKDFEKIINEVCEMLSICYSRFYDCLFKKNNITEIISKAMYLLRCLIESVELNANTPNFILLFIQKIYKKNMINNSYGIEQIPYDKIENFIMQIIEYDNLYENYHIEGTNITINQLLDMISNEKNEKRKY